MDLKIKSVETILSCSNWDEFTNSLRKFGNDPKYKKFKGEIFEYLVKYFLQVEPTFALQFKNIYHHSELGFNLREELKLPSPEIGVDLLAEYNDGTYCAIQCKFHQNIKQNVTYDELSTFFSVTERNETYNKISHRLICTSAIGISNKVNNLHNEKIGFLTYSDFSLLDQDLFNKIHNLIKGNKIVDKPFSPRDHQVVAIEKVKKSFEENDRGKIIHPCGSGKSLTAYWSAKKINAKHILVCLPSLALIRQTLKSWSKQAYSDGQKIDFLVICSDSDVSQIDDPLIKTYDLGIPVTTNVKKVSEFLNTETSNIRVVLTTYQSGEVISKSSKKNNFKFDLGIFDEAHKTTGDKNKKFGYLLNQNNIHVKKRLFMTATERQFKGDSNNFLSMDDTSVYGRVIDQLSFRGALEQDPPILCDYNVITVMVTKKDIEYLISENHLTKANGTNYSFLEDGATLAALIAHRKLSKEKSIKHTISFHSNIKRAKEFSEINNSLNNYFEDKSIDSYHVSGKMGMSERNYEIEKFLKSPSSIISNAKCLTEGVDIPAVDAVLFADPKKSLIDIVQAAGRAMRKHPNKSIGYIIIPVILNNGIEDKVNDTFKQLINVIAALGINDERIIDEAKMIVKTKRYNKKGSILQFEEFSPETEIKFEKLVKEIQIKIWDRLSFAKSVVGETEFNKWMQKNTRLSTSSINKYANAVRKISNDLVKLDLSYSSLEEITQKANLEELKKKYFSIPQYQALDTRGKGMYSAGFQRLIEFQNFRNQA